MEELVMKFVVNDIEYEIYHIDIINDDKDIAGITNPLDSKIYLKRMKSQKQMIRALKHELAHVWLLEFGHNQFDADKVFNNEDVCEIVSCSNDFINKFIEEYCNKTVTIE